MLDDHIPYSHDFSDSEDVDITMRNLTLITFGPYRVKEGTLIRHFVQKY